MSEEKEFKEDVLWVLRRESLGSKSKRILRVVSFNGGEPQLENRVYYKNKEDEWKVGKTKGLSLSDIELVQKYPKKLAKAMSGKTVIAL